MRSCPFDGHSQVHWHCAKSIDDCAGTDVAGMQTTNENIGMLLGARKISWGWFEGGFDLSLKNANNSTGCARTTSSQTGAFSPKVDYIPHHEPFQFYASTANPTHARPTGQIGTTDAANHQYDSKDFFDALQSGVLPSVVFLKAPGYQDGHPGYSSPIDEQTWVVGVINTLEESKFWSNTAVFIAWDDSDGWYDHQMSPTIFHSQTDGGGGGVNSADGLTGANACGSSSTA